jgi:hypothetical protein
VAQYCCCCFYLRCLSQRGAGVVVLERIPLAVCMSYPAFSSSKIRGLDAWRYVWKQPGQVSCLAACWFQSRALEWGWRGKLAADCKTQAACVGRGGMHAAVPCWAARFVCDGKRIIMPWLASAWSLDSCDIGTFHG